MSLAAVGEHGLAGQLRRGHVREVEVEKGLPRGIIHENEVTDLPVYHVFVAHFLFLLFLVMVNLYILRPGRCVKWLFGFPRVVTAMDWNIVDGIVLFGMELLFYLPYHMGKSQSVERESRKPCK